MADLNSEELLSEMLDEMRKGGGRVNAESMDKFNYSMRNSSTTVEGWNKKMEASAKRMENFSKSLEQAKGFGKSLAEGEATLDQVIGSVSSALRGIPILGGALGATFEMLGKQTQFSIKALSDLSQVGALGAGGIEGFKQQWKSSQVSLNTFTEYLKQNSVVLADMAGTVGKGAQQFSEFSQTIVTSETGEKLRQLGVSTDELMEESQSYLKVQTLLGRTQGKSARDLSLSTGSYIEQLDQLARLTGMSRKQQEQLREESLRESRWAAHQSSVSAEIGQQFDNLNTILKTKGGDEIAKGFRDLSNGIVNTDEAKKLIQATGGRVFAVVDELHKGGNAIKIFNEQFKPAVAGNIDMLKSLASYGNEYAGSYHDLLKLSNAATATEQELEQQAKESAKANALDAKLKQTLYDANLKFQQALVDAEPGFTKLMTWLTSGVGKFINIILDGVNALKHWNTITEATGKSMLEIAVDSIRDTLINSISDGIKLGLADTWIGEKTGMTRESVEQDIFARDMSKANKNWRDWSESIESLNKKLKGMEVGSDEFNETIDNLNYAQKQQAKAAIDQFTLQKKNNVNVDESTKLLEVWQNKLSELSKNTLGTSSVAQQQGTTITGQNANARANAEAYLGSKISDAEYSELLKAVHAEAGSDQLEAAGVMASILNRARSRFKGSIHAALYEENAFQSVTGTKKNGRQPHPNFVNGPGAKRQESIENAASLLSRWSKDQTDFSAESNKAYGEGTTTAWRDNMSKDNVVGGTRFGTHVLGAATGGLVSGPLGGFPAVLHGDEMITPVNNSAFPRQFSDAFHTMLDEYNANTDNVTPVTNELGKVNQSLVDAVRKLTQQVELMQAMITHLSRGADAHSESAKAQRKLAAAAV